MPTKVNYTDLSPEDIADAMDLSRYNITDLFETDFCGLVDLNQTDADYLVMKLEPEVMLLEQQAEKNLKQDRPGSRDLNLCRLKSSVFLIISVMCHLYGIRLAIVKTIVATAGPGPAPVLWKWTWHTETTSAKCSRFSISSQTITMVQAYSLAVVDHLPGLPTFTPSSEDGHSLEQCQCKLYGRLHPLRRIHESSRKINSHGAQLSYREGDGLVVPTHFDEGAMDNQTAISNIKGVLHSNKAVIFNYALDDWAPFMEFWNSEPEEAIWIPRRGSSYSDGPDNGAHTVLCLGYNDTDPNNRYWILLNSWGAPNNRSHGLFLLSMDLNYSSVYEEGINGYNW